MTTQAITIWTAAPTEANVSDMLGIAATMPEHYPDTRDRLHVTVNDTAAALLLTHRPYQADRNAHALKLNKRTRRATRDLGPHQPQALIAPEAIHLTLVDDPRGLWDGISRISADWPTLLGAEATGRYEITCELPNKGIVKGHALIDPTLGPRSIVTAPGNVTRELMPTGSLAALTLEAKPAKTPYTDVQSLVNLAPVMAPVVVDAYEAMREEARDTARAIVANETPHPYPPLLPGHYRNNPATLKAYLATYRNHLHRIANELHAPMRQAARLYLTSSAAAGMRVTAGHARLDPDHSAVIVANADYGRIAATLGGADQDDAILIIADRDGRLILWRNPNAPGEYVTLKATRDGQQLTRYDCRADDLAQMPRVIVQPQDGLTTDADPRDLARMAANQRDAQTAIGAACNLLILAAANHKAVRLPVTLEAIVDNAAKGGNLNAAALITWTNERMIEAITRPTHAAIVPRYLAGRYRPALWHYYAGRIAPDGRPTEQQAKRINAQIARHIAPEATVTDATPTTNPAQWLHRELLALKERYTEWSETQRSRYTSPAALTEASHATLARGIALHALYQAEAMRDTRDPDRWTKAARETLAQMDGRDDYLALLLATEANHGRTRNYPHAATAAPMRETAADALATTATLSPAEAAQAIAAKDNAPSNGRLQAAREAARLLVDRPARMDGSSLTIELADGRTHRINGLTTNGRGGTTYHITTATLNAAGTLVIGLAEAAE